MQQKSRGILRISTGTPDFPAPDRQADTSDCHCPAGYAARATPSVFAARAAGVAERRAGAARRWEVAESSPRPSPVSISISHGVARGITITFFCDPGVFSSMMMVTSGPAATATSSVPSVSVARGSNSSAMPAAGSAAVTASSSAGSCSRAVAGAHTWWPATAGCWRAVCCWAW